MRSLLTTFIITLIIFNSVAKCANSGKDIFYNSKGKYGTCNTCHTNGGSAGRFDISSGEVSDDEGKKIPSLKGIGKRKEREHIERDVVRMENTFGFKLSDFEIEQLVDYVSTY